MRYDMRMTEQSLRSQVRKMLYESESLFPTGLSEESMGQFEKIWRKITEIVSSLEASMVENHFDDVFERAQAVRKSLIQQHGNIVFTPNRFPGSDLLMNTGYMARNVLHEDPMYAQDMKKIDNLLKLMYTLLLKRSEKIDPNTSDFHLQQLLGDMNNYVETMIVSYVSALAVEKVIDDTMPGWTVLAQDNPRFSLRNMIGRAVYWSQL